MSVTVSDALAAPHDHHHSALTFAPFSENPSTSRAASGEQPPSYNPPQASQAQPDQGQDRTAPAGSQHATAPPSGGSILPAEPQQPSWHGSAFQQHLDAADRALACRQQARAQASAQVAPARSHPTSTSQPAGHAAHQAASARNTQEPSSCPAQRSQQAAQHDLQHYPGPLQASAHVHQQNPGLPSQPPPPHLLNLLPMSSSELALYPHASRPDMGDPHPDQQHQQQLSQHVSQPPPHHQHSDALHFASPSGPPHDHDHSLPSTSAPDPAHSRAALHGQLHHQHHQHQHYPEDQQHQQQHHQHQQHPDPQAPPRSHTEHHHHHDHHHRHQHQHQHHEQQHQQHYQQQAEVQRPQMNLFEQLLGQVAVQCGDAARARSALAATAQPALAPDRWVDDALMWLVQQQAGESGADSPSLGAEKDNLAAAMEASLAEAESARQKVADLPRHKQPLAELRERYKWSHLLQQIPDSNAEALWADEGALQSWVDLLELERNCRHWYPPPAVAAVFGEVAAKLMAALQSGMAMTHLGGEAAPAAAAVADDSTPATAADASRQPSEARTEPAADSSREQSGARAEAVVDRRASALAASSGSHKGAITGRTGEPARQIPARGRSQEPGRQNSSTGRTPDPDEETGPRRSKRIRTRLHGSSPAIASSAGTNRAGGRKQTKHHRGSPDPAQKCSSASKSGDKLLRASDEPQRSGSGADASTSPRQEQTAAEAGNRTAGKDATDVEDPTDGRGPTEPQRAGLQDASAPEEPSLPEQAEEGTDEAQHHADDPQHGEEVEADDDCIIIVRD